MYNVSLYIFVGYILCIITIVTIVTSTTSLVTVNIWLYEVLLICMNALTNYLLSLVVPIGTIGNIVCSNYSM